MEHSGAGARPDREFGTSAAVVARERGPWLHVRVELQGAAAWTGAFELDAAGHYLTGVYGMPSGEHPLVAAGGESYVVSAHGPDQWHWTPFAPLIGVRRVDGSPLVVLWDFQGLGVYAAEGPRWHRLHFATDDLDITRAADGVIEGQLWRGDFRSDHPRPFRVDAASGACSRARRTANSSGAAFWDG